MHCPKVLARTATPVEMITTSVTPGMALTAARLPADCTVPLIVGGRHTIVGNALATFTSIANLLRPVTMSRASTRPRAVPITVNFDGSLSCTRAVVDTATDAATASDPYVAVWPFGP
jgi:hypothetical protein